MKQVLMSSKYIKTVKNTDGKDDDGKELQKVISLLYELMDFLIFYY